MKYLTFKVGEADLAFQIENVEGVIEEIKIVPIPKSPEHVEGIANIRNQIIPVVSLAKLLDKELVSGQKWIVVVSGNSRCVCEIDVVGDLIETEEVVPVKGRPSIIVGSIEKHGEIYSIIDPRRITRR